MTLKDKVRFITARILSKKTVLFPNHHEWKIHIKNKIKSDVPHYVPFFYNFNETNPHRFDLIMPLTISSQKYLNKKFNCLNGHKAIYPSSKAIKLCDDKYAFTRYLINNGFENSVPRTNKKFNYPYVLKRKKGNLE